MSSIEISEPEIILLNRYHDASEDEHSTSFDKNEEPAVDDVPRYKKLYRR